MNCCEDNSEEGCGTLARQAWRAYLTGCDSQKFSRRARGLMRTMTRYEFMGTIINILPGQTPEPVGRHDSEGIPEQACPSRLGTPLKVRPRVDVRSRGESGGGELAQVRLGCPSKSPHMGWQASENHFHMEVGHPSRSREF